MKIEIFVVITELAQAGYQALNEQKVELCKQFGGLTETTNCKGYWLNNGKLELDVVNIWTIYSSTKSDLVITATYDIIKRYAEQIKAICNQESQLFVIDDKPTFV